MKRAATLLAALAVAFAATAATVRTATENFVTNKIAEAVAAIPSPDLSPLTNYVDFVAQYIRTNENLRSFVKEDGTVYHWITNGIWAVNDLHGDGWDDSYLSGARLYLWEQSGQTNWTWYITGGPSSPYRTITAGANAEVLRFKYSDSKTNVFIRGGALMYAETVGGMISSKFNAASRITTNDVRNIVTNFSGSWSCDLGTLTERYGNFWRGIFGGNYVVELTYSAPYWIIDDDATGLSLNESVEAPADSRRLVFDLADDSTAATLLGTNKIVLVRKWLLSDYALFSEVPTIAAWARAATKPTYTASEVGATTPADVTAAIREQSLGGIWDEELQVWWTPRMRNGSLTYEATTNVNLNAEN